MLPTRLTALVQLRVHDGADTGQASLMYRADTSAERMPDIDAAIRHSRFQAQEYVTLAGHTWTVQLNSLPEFDRVHERNASTLILVAGLLLGLITHQLVSRSSRSAACRRRVSGP